MKNSINITCDKCGEKHTIHFDQPIIAARLKLLEQILALPKFVPGGDNPYTYICVDDIVEIDNNKKPA